MSDVLPFRAAAALDVHTVFPEQKKAFSSGYVVGGAGFRHFEQFRSINSGARKIVIFWCSDWPKIVFLFHSIACNFEFYAAHRRSLLHEAAAEEEDTSR